MPSRFSRMDFSDTEDQLPPHLRRGDKALRWQSPAYMAHEDSKPAFSSARDPSARQALETQLAFLKNQVFDQIRFPEEYAHPDFRSQVNSMVGSFVDMQFSHMAAEQGLGLCKGDKANFSNRESYPDYVLNENHRIELKTMRAGGKASANLHKNINMETIRPDHDLLMVAVFDFYPCADEPGMVSPMIKDFRLFSVAECIEARDRNLEPGHSRSSSIQSIPLAELKSFINKYRYDAGAFDHQPEREKYNAALSLEERLNAAVADHNTHVAQEKMDKWHGLGPTDVNPAALPTEKEGKWGDITQPQALSHLQEDMDKLISQEIKGLRIHKGLLHRDTHASISKLIGAVTDLEFEKIAQENHAGITKAVIPKSGKRQSYPDFRHEDGYNIELKSVRAGYESRAKIKPNSLSSKYHADKDALCILVYDLVPDPIDDQFMKIIIKDVELFPMKDCLEAVPLRKDGTLPSTTSLDRVRHEGLQAFLEKAKSSSPQLETGHKANLRDFSFLREELPPAAVRNTQIGSGLVEELYQIMHPTQKIIDPPLQQEYEEPALVSLASGPSPF